MSLSIVPFGKTPTGGHTSLYTLTNANGMIARFTDFGAILVSLEVPDGKGAISDVVLGYDTLAEYVADLSCFGASIGRYANRIAFGRFVLDGKTYELETNNGRHHLHGGSRGFRKSLFRAQPGEDANGPSVRFTLLSPAGEYGYPGNLEAEYLYRLGSDNALRVEITARADAPTPLNLTHHSYFNLSGAGNGDILDHELTLFADTSTATDEELIPTGMLAPVDGTPRDFRQSRTIGSLIGGTEGGYDHNFVLRDPDGAFGPAARLRSPGGGLELEVWTTQPGLQVYTGNHLHGVRGKKGRLYGKHAGVSLEPQHFPDSPNRPTFPDTILRPGQRFFQASEFRFKGF